VLHEKKGKHFTEKKKKIEMVFEMITKTVFKNLLFITYFAHLQLKTGNISILYGTHIPTKINK